MYKELSASFHQSYHRSDGTCARTRARTHTHTLIRTHLHTYTHTHSPLSCTTIIDRQSRGRRCRCMCVGFMCVGFFWTYCIVLYVPYRRSISTPLHHASQYSDYTHTHKQTPQTHTHTSLSCAIIFDRESTGLCFKCSLTEKVFFEVMSSILIPQEQRRRP